MKALVVEADAATRALLVELLRLRGHEVTTAVDLEMAWSLHQREGFALFILNWSDLQLDSRELCRRVRAAPRGEDPFILAIVAPEQADALLAVLDAGANDFLAEPRHVALLRARLAVAERHVASTAQRRRSEEELERRALHDALTELPNRVLLFERVRQSIVAARRHSTGLALLLLDLDRFKEVNDTLGHHAGDLLLRQLSQRLQDALRQSDTVARLGGDEFGILLPDTDREGAIWAARKVVQTLDPGFQLEGHEISLNASVGISLYPEHGEDTETLLQHADVAMYEAKRMAGGYSVYDEGRDEHSPQRLALTSELRRAIEREEFILHYLPQINLRSGRVIGLEALVRWEHPQRGLLLPGEFIPLAEQTGLIGPLCGWVLNAALRQCQVWRRTGVRLPIEVNLSVRNLHDPHLPDTVARMLEMWGVAPASLRLEIAEHAVSEQLERASHTLGRLHTMGVGIGLDDFGTGSASRASLERLALDELKVDRSFVHDMLVDAHNADVVRSAIELGHHLGVPVVAEGVGDAETRDALTRYGCDLAQGYFLARPMAAFELFRWLNHTNGNGNGNNNGNGRH